MDFEKANAIAQRLLEAAEAEVAALDQDPRCASMALAAAIQQAVKKHGTYPALSATLLEFGFADCGAHVDGMAMVSMLTTARDLNAKGGLNLGMAPTTKH